MYLRVKKITDFKINGIRNNPIWDSIEWNPLIPIREDRVGYNSRVKVAYSDSGIYFLADFEDKRLTCTKTADFEDLYNEDVFEIFLWPDESQNCYFEYELSPLDFELPLLVINNQGNFHGWLPWHYEDARKCGHGTSVRGGLKYPMAPVDGWSAEVFIPFALFQGFGNSLPVSGTIWRANMYRIDYDLDETVRWAWCIDTGIRFHDISNFGTFVFE